MVKTGTLEEFLATEATKINIPDFFINIIIAAILSTILARFYVKYGRCLSNRKMLASNFLLVTITTTFIISIIKSSLALSLGLVGALSIVRFRAAIKEPEELAYLFLSIAVGLGLGAGQRTLSVVAFTIIIVLAWFQNRSHIKDAFNSVFVNVSSKSANDVNLDGVIEKLREYCSRIDLKRVEDGDHGFEASFLVEFNDYERLMETIRDLRSLHKSVNVTVIEPERIRP